ncbi:MAG: filamentous hemagglutinin family protein [Clostridia bacterium]|nr:filamentous hemagglutinin family protein [Clostridia bacterium]
MGAGIHGGFGGTNGSLSGKGKSQSLPTKEAQLKHIFSGKNGHLTDTPANRSRLINLANDNSKFIGKDKYGNSWNAETNKDGSQTWVRYQNGTINEGGLNSKPRPWNNETGLNNNPVKRRRKK